MLNALPKTYIKLVHSWFTGSPNAQHTHADLYINGRHIDCFEFDKFDDRNLLTEL